jgi:site-specific recombinase XerD
VEVSGFKTALEAKDNRIKALNQVKEGNYITHKLTMKELCKNYLQYKKKRIKESSYHSLEDVVKIHIEPEIGGIKLEKLEAKDIEDLLDKISEQVSKKRANTILKYLRAIFEYGINRKKLSYNPAKAVEPFKVKNLSIIFYAGMSQCCCSMFAPLRIK